MNYPYSKLFNKAGYIPLNEYIKDIDHMRKHGPWKLPLAGGDYLHFLFLKFVAKFSWFSESLYIENATFLSPSYAVLFAYLKRNKIFDTLYDRNLHFPGYFSFYLEKGVIVNKQNYLLGGQGVSEDVSTAFSVALGEILERNITGIGDKNANILEASSRELHEKKMDILYPPRYHRFLPAQKKRYSNLYDDENTILRWVQGVNLISKRKTYIPRQITSWFIENGPEKPVLISGTTNGSAGYFTEEGAILRGLLEVVQRDGFLTHWLTTIPPQIILIESLPEDIQKKIKHFADFGISIYVVNATALSIPTVFVIAINRESEHPQVVLSGSSELTFEKAIMGALKEILIAAEVFYIDKKLTDFPGIDKKIEPFTSNLNKIGRQLYWRGEDVLKNFDWFLSGKRISYTDLATLNLISNEEDKSKLDRCLEVLKKKGEEYYPVVYYPKNKIQEKVGFRVVQVFIPKAFPLYLFEGYGTFDSDRLKEFAQERGVEHWKLNTLPHMFS